jgi:hypothetical protein
MLYAMNKQKTIGENLWHKFISFAICQRIYVQLFLKISISSYRLCQVVREVVVEGKSEKFYFF